MYRSNLIMAGQTDEEQAILLKGVGTQCDVIKKLTGVDIYAGQSPQNVPDVPTGIPVTKPEGM